jgi:hypothetical protein
MTQRIGTGANAEITTYAVTLDTTPRQVECSQPVGSAVGALTSQSVSATASRVLSTGPVNPGRFYVQGATLINTDASITVYLASSGSYTTTTAWPLAAGASIRIDASRLDNLYLFAASGTPVVKVIGV